MDDLLSLTGRRWMLKERVSDDADIVSLLAKQRGLTDILGGKEPLLSSPMLFAEMGRAVERIKRAMENEETVGIFGDYDADGITATAQLVRYFRRQGIEPAVYLPHREHDGYGLKKKSIDALREKGVSLIITVDTGIGAHSEIEYAKTLDIDVIVTDHHHALAGRPPAYAVIHPHIPSEFPNPHLSGAGVAFMLVRALEPKPQWPGIEEDFVLAAIGTIGDLVPLVGENRTLVMHGLKFLHGLTDGPLKEFAQFVQSRGAPLSSIDIAFRIVPRINASGRMDEPSIALQALLDGGPALHKLHELNSRRQTLMATLVAQAETMVNGDDLFLCIAHDDFTHGIVGLIAGKLTEKYGRPSLVACVKDGICTASLRSIPRFDITAALSHLSVAPLLLSYGGHSQAAGCSFSLTNFDAVKKALHERMVEAGLSLDHLVPTVDVDLELQPAQLHRGFAQEIRVLEPFGVENEEPLFLLRNQKLANIRTVGSDGTHLQAMLFGRKLIGFGLGKLAPTLKEQAKVDLVFSVSCDTWNGTNDCQLVLRDIRKAQ